MTLFDVCTPSSVEKPGPRALGNPSLKQSIMGDCGRYFSRSLRIGKIGASKMSDNQTTIQSEHGKLNFLLFFAWIGFLGAVAIITVSICNLITDLLSCAFVRFFDMLAHLFVRRDNREDRNNNNEPDLELVLMNNNALRERQ